MIKLISFLRFLPEFTTTTGRDRYENVHVPLVLKLFPMIGAYRRNYLPERGSAGRPELAYDVVTELCFADDKAFAAFQELGRGEAGKTVSADGAALFDRSVTVTCPVAEVASPIAG